ncbi:pentatricopeptide repeat-containing protein At2g30100, chloroplastic [Amborella trichopoda]|nr:pentatricopeptide repeat-containing protein At2g30100, chloroplastic [Amborella trichopoda]|eukprot:XP_006847406.2 pentatricopeptide repeat-containing protein At2g30100, chloroplastic [Amborella trichopoda]
MTHLRFSAASCKTRIPICISSHVVKISPHFRLTPMGFFSLSTKNHSHGFSGFVLKTSNQKWLQIGLSSMKFKSLLASKRSNGGEPGTIISGFSGSLLDLDGMNPELYEAIEELERMDREPSDILEEMSMKLSARDLQLVLVYFSQEGRDSWCALEVFDWLRRVNRVDKETMELMVSIMCLWLAKLIDGDHPIDQLLDLLQEMDCVGLKPEFSMIEKVISLYWDGGKKDQACSFLELVIQRGLAKPQDQNEQGPTGYLAWKMMVDGDYRGAVNLVIELTEKGLEPELYSYVIAMTALVKEQNEFSKALRKLKTSQKKGLIAQFGEEELYSLENYQLGLLSDGEKISNRVINGQNVRFIGVIHEKLLALYSCAGRGAQAEHHLWQMKLAGKEPDREMYAIVMAICASENNKAAVLRLMAGLESLGFSPRKKTSTWLLRGYLKGGHFVDASNTLMNMLNKGFRPENVDIAVVLQRLRKSIHDPGNVELYLKLCKRLSEADLIVPCLVYLYVPELKLWIMKIL